MSSITATYDMSQHDLKEIKKEIENKIIDGIKSVTDFFNSNFEIYNYCNQEQLFILLGITFEYRFEDNEIYIDKYVNSESEIKTDKIKSGFAIFEKMQESFTIVFDSEHNIERVDVVCVSVSDNILVSLMLNEKIKLYSYAYMEMGNTEIFKDENTFLSTKEEIEFITLKKACKKNKEIYNLLPELYIDTVCDYSSEEFNDRLNYCKILMY